jgi:hypothetical protein
MIVGIMGVVEVDVVAKQLAANWMELSLNLGDDRGQAAAA